MLNRVLWSRGFISQHVLESIILCSELVKKVFLYIKAQTPLQKSDTYKRKELTGSVCTLDQIFVVYHFEKLSFNVK